MATVEVTKLTNLINPQVMGDMINAKIEAQLKLTPYAKLDRSLVGVPGDTKTVPSWGYIGDAESIGENEEIDYSDMSATSVPFTIGKAGKGVTITTEAINSGMGNPVGQAETQLAKAIAGKVENDVLNAALTATMTYDGTAGIIGYDGIVGAVGKFEDEEDGIEKVMFIHPKQETQLLKDDNFLSADKFTSGVAVNGAIGKIAGCWVKKSKRVPKVDAVAAVKGVYTLTIGGAAAVGDKLYINDKLVYTAGAADNATTIVTALKTAIDADDDLKLLWTTAKNAGVLTLTEKAGKEGLAGEPIFEEDEANTGTIAGNVATTTEGTATSGAYYKNPIIKMEPDSAETEYTEDELPAITIFLKKDTTVNSFYNQNFDRHEITAYRYYGVAKTNDAKLVVAKFAQTAQA